MKTKISTDISAKEYHAGKASPSNLGGAVSKSLLWEFNKSPYKWLNSQPKPPTEAMRLGSLIHTLCLTPGEFPDAYAVSPYDSFRTNESKAWRQEQEDAGKSVINQGTLDHAASIAECVTETEILHHLGERQYEAIVESDFHGIRVCGMIDIAPDYGNTLVDLKPTNSIESLDALTRLVYNRGYHWQAAMYLDLWNAATGEERDQFQLLFIEFDDPHETAIVTLSQEVIADGRDGYMNALMRWNECIRKNHFPKAVEGLQTIEKPHWKK